VVGTQTTLCSIFDEFDSDQVKNAEMENEGQIVIVQDQLNVLSWLHSKLILNRIIFKWIFHNVSHSYKNLKSAAYKEFFSTLGKIENKGLKVWHMSPRSFQETSFYIKI